MKFGYKGLWFDMFILSKNLLLVLVDKGIIDKKLYKNLAKVRIKEIITPIELTIYLFFIRSYPQAQLKLENNLSYI